MLRLSSAGLKSDVCGWNGTFVHAFFAKQRVSQKLRAPFFRCHPGPLLPWRVVPQVLRMAAFQIGYPVAVFVLMKRDDAAVHIFSFIVLRAVRRFSVPRSRCLEA